MLNSLTFISNTKPKLLMFTPQFERGLNTARLFDKDKISIRLTANQKHADILVNAEFFDIVYLDTCFGEGSSNKFAPLLKKISPATKVVLTTDQAEARKFMDILKPILNICLLADPTSPLDIYRACQPEFG